MPSSASFKRTYFVTTYTELQRIEPGESTKGYIFALTDADGLYYDLEDPSSGKVERRKASGIKFADVLDPSAAEAETIFVVPTGNAKDENGNTYVSYSGYIWEQNTATQPPTWESYEIFNNSKDFQVKSEAVDSISRKSFVVFSPSLDNEGTCETSTDSLIKNSSFYVDTDGKLYGTVSNADHADTADYASSADTANSAEKDDEGNTISGYFNNVYASSVSGGTQLTFDKGDGTSTSVTAKDTTYSTFTSSKAGLVPRSGTISTQSSSVLLTSVGWKNTSDIPMPSADSATKDGLDQNIADTYIKGLAWNAGTLTITRGDDDTSTIPVPDTTYSVFAIGSTGLVPAPSNSDTLKFLKGDHTWAAVITPTDIYDGTNKGIVPDPPTGTGATEKYLRSDGSWNGAFSSSADGLVPKTSTAASTDVLHADGSWGAETDTKNTSGATQNANFLYLIGALNQDTNPQTYSNAKIYVDGDKLYSNAIEVVNLSDSQALINKTYEGYTLGSACAVDASSSVTQTVLPVTDNFTGDGSTTAFTLSESPISVTSVTVAGTTTTAYTIADKTLTFTTAPASGAAIIVNYTKADPNYDSGNVPTNNAVITYVNSVKSTLSQNIATKLDFSAIAPTYDSTATYTVGDYCVWDDGNGARLFQCNTAISTPELFDPTKWDVTLICELHDDIFENTEILVGHWFGEPLYEVTLSSTTYYDATAVQIADISNLTINKICSISAISTIGVPGSNDIIFSPASENLYITNGAVMAKQSLAAQQAGSTMQTYITIRYTKPSA